MKDQTVQAYSDMLTKLGIEHKFVEHPELKTPLDVQRYLGLRLADGLSTMIMKAGDEFVAVIRRDDCRMDFDNIKKVLGVKSLRVANEKEFTELTGMPIGAARVYNPGTKTLLDTKLFDKELLTGGTGSFTCSFRYRSEDLKKIPGSIVVDIASIASDGEKILVGRKRILSGITPSGDGSLHIGNYLGAVKQFKEFAKENECFLFVADLHALTTIQNKDQLKQNIETLILNELALLMGESGELGNITFFRQSDVPMHTELQSILNNVTPLGLLKRAHAYKDKLQKDIMEDEINLGLFNYPILMAADILLYKPDLVPVGKDQKQHVEITRDIAERFNRTFRKQLFKLPDAYIPEEVAVILGTDGQRKMSKSLGNIISIFDEEDVIKKQVMGCFTDPTRKRATDPGHIEGNMVFAYLDFFGDPTSSTTSSGLRGAGKVEELKKLYQEGKVGDVEVKQYLFESLMKTFAPARARYQELKNHPEQVKQILKDGATRAHAFAEQTMTEVRDVIGVTNQYSFFSYGSAK